MCDYSLQHKASRPAKVGEKLRTTNFGTGTRGFASPEDSNTAVCVLPGTELAFNEAIRAYGSAENKPSMARFAQINKESLCMHHDCLEFADGTSVLLTFLVEGQECSVLQLPAEPKNEAEVEEQKRAEFV